MYRRSPVTKRFFGNRYARDQRRYTPRYAQRCYGSFPKMIGCTAAAREHQTITRPIPNVFRKMTRSTEDVNSVRPGPERSRCALKIQRTQPAEHPRGSLADASLAFHLRVLKTEFHQSPLPPQHTFDAPSPAVPAPPPT